MSAKGAFPQRESLLQDNRRFQVDAELLASNWRMAETGTTPPAHLECETGDSGGGFDRLRFRFPKQSPQVVEKSAISTKLLLNKRNDGREKS